MGKISEEDAEMLAQKFAEKLQAARSVSDSEHYDHHRWITERIEAEKRRRRFYEQMSEHALKWGMLSILSFLFYALWLGFKAWAHINGNGSP